MTEVLERVLVVAFVAAAIVAVAVIVVFSVAGSLWAAGQDSQVIG